MRNHTSLATTFGLSLALAFSGAAFAADGGSGANGASGASSGPAAGGTGTVFGDGLRCAGGMVVRLGTKTNVAGSSHYPAAGDPSVSVRGSITAPGTRTYQVWYRNAASFCTPSTFNLSNGLSIVWM